MLPDRWDPEAVRLRFLGRAASARRGIQKDLDKIERDDRLRATAQTTIDMAWAEVTVCTAVAHTALATRDSLLAELDRLRAAPPLPAEGARDLERYTEQYWRTCEQLIADWTA